METISETIRREIKRRGLYASEAARLAGVSVSTITRFLRGERGLGGESMERLAEAFGLTLVPVEEVEDYLEIERQIGRAVEINDDLKALLRAILKSVRRRR